MTNETMSKEANVQPEAGVMAGPCSKNVELLAPAGNMECLHAAVKAGADAVYLGAGHFNARRGADNSRSKTWRKPAITRIFAV